MKNVLIQKAEQDRKKKLRRAQIITSIMSISVMIYCLVIMFTSHESTEIENHIILFIIMGIIGSLTASTIMEEELYGRK